MNISQKKTVCGHELSHWRVGKREFLGWFTRNYLGALEVKEKLEEEGWTVEKVEEVPYGIYQLSAERNIVEEQVDEKPTDEPPSTDDVTGELE